MRSDNDDLPESALSAAAEELFRRLDAEEARNIPQSLRQELARRKKKLKQNPAFGLTWEEVQRRVRGRRRRPRN